MIEKISDKTKSRVLNTHYFMPPGNMMVELMTDGYTHPEIFPFLAERHKEAGLFPFVARKESTGFIFNRVWAAIKREFLTILAEDVSTPEELDQMWTLFWGSKQAPCQLMDRKSSSWFSCNHQKITNDVLQRLGSILSNSLKNIMSTKEVFPKRKQSTSWRRTTSSKANLETNVRKVVCTLLRHPTPRRSFFARLVYRSR
jgi:3-hydroxyacyl-CoA dehydrogenase